MEDTKYGKGRLAVLKEMKEWYQKQIDSQKEALSDIAKYLQQGEIRAHKKALQKIIDKESKSLIKSLGK